MELADLMGHGAEHRCDRRRIQRRAIGGDTAHGQLASLQGALKVLEKGDHIVVRRIMIQDLIKQALEGAVVHDGQHTKRAIVELVNRQIPGKIG
jgi:hypothetical protein